MAGHVNNNLIWKINSYTFKCLTQQYICHYVRNVTENFKRLYWNGKSIGTIGIQGTSNARTDEHWNRVLLFFGHFSRPTPISFLKRNTWDGLLLELTYFYKIYQLKLLY